MKEEDREIITLRDDEGNENEFEIIDYYISDDNDYYFALIPNETDEKSNSEVTPTFILKVVEKDGEELLEPIEDEEEYEKIAGFFMEHLEDIYNFES